MRREIYLPNQRIEGDLTRRLIDIDRSKFDLVDGCLKKNGRLIGEEDGERERNEFFQNRTRRKPVLTEGQFRDPTRSSNYKRRRLLVLRGIWSVGLRGVMLLELKYL